MAPLHNLNAVLLLAHGTPDRLDEIPEYLRNVTGGRPVPDSVIEELRNRYSLIGHSPLTEITLRQADLLSRSLGIPVYVGMRNWRPYVAETIERMRRDGVRQFVALCLAPQNSRTSVGLYRQATLSKAEGMDVRFVNSWHDRPLLIEAFAERLASALARHPDAAVLFTAHSVPARTIEAGDPYERQTQDTAALVARKLNLSDSEWFFAFQSQGMSGGPWLGPTVEETLSRIRQLGKKRVVVQPIGFVCDHVEVLYDIDIAFRKFAASLGLELFRAESLNDSPRFIAALAEIVSTQHSAISIQSATVVTKIGST